VLAKRTLTRIVRRPDGVLIDPTGKLNGRGAYVHDRKSCWERSLKGALASALKASFSAEDLQRLEDYAASLPEESVSEADAQA